jgi:hypothetical protein
MGWRDLAVRFNQFTLAKGLGGPAFHWNKVAARYLDFIKLLYVECGLESEEETSGDENGEEREDCATVER